MLAHHSNRQRLIEGLRSSRCRAYRFAMLYSGLYIGGDEYNTIILNLMKESSLMREDRCAQCTVRGRTVT